ncbi:hypothetical protein WBP06_07065 [Novosphingobium sp. BL-8H]
MMTVLAFMVMIPLGFDLGWYANASHSQQQAFGGDLPGNVDRSRGGEIV